MIVIPYSIDNDSLYLFDIQTKLGVLICSVARSHLEDMSGFLLVFLWPCVLAFSCYKEDSCYYPDTKLLGLPFLGVRKQNIYPRSCVATCMSTDGCVGVTFDPRDDMCQFYTESASFGLAQGPGVDLWLFQAPGVPCLRVSEFSI